MTAEKRKIRTLGEGLEGNLEGNLGEDHLGAYRDGNQEEEPYQDGSQEVVPCRAYREVAPCPLGGILAGVYRLVAYRLEAYRLGAYHGRMPLVVRQRQDRGATSFLGQVHQRRELVQSILEQLQVQRAYHDQQVQQLLIQRSTVIVKIKGS